MENDKKEERETPIIDGDARPDQNVEGLKDSKRERTKQAAEKTLTKERGADINTLEDYKDAKEA